MTLTSDTDLSPLDRLAEAFAALDGHALNGSNTRLQQLRRDSMARVEQLGLPTRRSEAWKYTPIEKQFEAPLHVVAGAAQPWGTAADVDAALVPDLDAFVAVLVNGAFQPALSRLDGLPQGVVVMGLKAALEEQPERVESHLDAYTRSESDVFMALNAAFLTDGLFVDVARGVAPEKPLHIVHLVEATERSLVQPRVLVVAGENAHITLVETFRVSGEALVNSVSEFAVGARARVAHYRVEDEGEMVSHVSATEAYQHGQSFFASTTITLSGDVVRNNAYVRPGGEGGESHLYGLFLAEGTTHVDNATFLDHAAPHCESTELYKGVLWDEARGVFNGKVLVRPDAQKTNAYQSSRSIVLSDRAEMYSKPELEIYADDVKCSHGAATGKLDPDALFYLRARGLSRAQARALMLLAFARDVTDTITIPALHDWLDAHLQRRFHAE